MCIYRKMNGSQKENSTVKILLLLMGKKKCKLISAKNA